MASIIIDDDTKLKAFLAHVTQRVREDNDQLVFVDLEGVNLGRSGKVAIMQMLMPPSPTVYLIDVHVLGAGAFDIATDDETNLKTVLESRNIFKVFFDVRNDSDALHAHFGVNIAGVIDLQVLEYATRIPRGKFVNGLAKCIEKDLPYVPGWCLVKAKGRRLFAPELGGQYEVFLKRPLDADIIKYCEQDVVLMPQLLARYGQKLNSRDAPQLSAIVNERIQLSKTPTFNGTGRHMAVGPFLAPLRDSANTPTSREADIICSAQLGRLCRLDDVVIDDITSQFGAVLVKQDQAPMSDSVISDSNLTASSNVTGAAVTHTTSAELSAFISTLRPDADDQDESDGDSEDGWRTGYASFDRDDDADLDFTACSADDCGYCGKCDY